MSIDCKRNGINYQITREKEKDRIKYTEKSYNRERKILIKLKNSTRNVKEIRKELTISDLQQKEPIAHEKVSIYRT